MNLNSFYKWRGEVRSTWESRGINQETFKIMTRMRGSEIRLRILQELTLPRNRMELSLFFNMNWRTIDSHIAALYAHGLVDEIAIVGTSKYFIITQKGIIIKQLLEKRPDKYENMLASKKDDVTTFLIVMTMMYFQLASDIDSYLM